MTDIYRLYDSARCGRDGYPPEWHQTIKHAVRADAGQRCVRCQHPYQQGAGEWSDCDERCAHTGPRRAWAPTIAVWLPLTEPALHADMVDEGRVQAQWRILTVHHLDNVKHNCRWWNLAALCQRCHLQIQGKVQMARVWPWEHSTWFQPYVAGYYAYTYLGEELTRPQALARLDELLALERIAA